MSKPLEPESAPLDPGARPICSTALSRAQEALAARPPSPRTAPEDVRTGLPPPLREHVEGCPVCQREIRELALGEIRLLGSFEGMRRRLPGPSDERLEAILAGIAARSPEAVLLGRIRRTVRRMLWLTLILLTLLAASALAWALARWLRLHNHP